MPISKIKTSSILADAASTNLNIDAGTLFLDATNNRVGINTTTLTGSTRMVVADATGNGQIRAIHSTGSGLLINQATASGVAYIQQQDNDALAFATNNTERARIDSSGNVGIGTTSPQAKLDVRTAALGTALQLSDDTNYGANFIGVSGGLKLAMNGSQTFAIFQSTNERLTINSSGNVGIGTSSPNKKLEVVGTGEIIRATSNTGANDQVISIKSNSGTADCSTNIFFADRYAATSYASSYIRGTSSGTSALIFATGGTNFTNIYDAGAPTERMRIDTSGNLGVGTTSPSTGKFGDASYAFLIQSASTSTGTNIFASNSDNSKFVGFWSGHSGAEPAVGVKTGNAFTFGKWAAINGTGGFTENMRIDSSGNVGIGTTSPTTRLSVVSATNGGISVNDGTVNTIIFNSTGGVASIGTTTNHPVDFYTNNAARMRIDSSGNVGIGTSVTAGNTLRYLDVQNSDTGSSAGTIIRIITSNVAASGTTSVDIVKYKTGGFYINNNEPNAAAFTAFQVGASERMRIDSSGRVTIPNQPSFSAQRSTGLAAPNVIIFDTVITNIGSNYSTSTGRFTAPVAGVYFFYLTFTCDRTTTTGDYYADIRKNASVFLRVYTQGDSDASSHPSQSGQIVFSLATGDYVDCRFESGATGIHANSIHNVFGGHLIG